MITTQKSYTISTQWPQSRAVWRAVGPTKKIQMGPFNISKHLDRCVLFRASCKLAPWAALFQNLTKLN